MINNLIHLLFVTTTLGLIFMETGSYGITIAETGHYNGVTFFYIIFWMIFYIVYYNVQKYSFYYDALGKLKVCKNNFLEKSFLYSNNKVYKIMIFSLILIFIFAVIHVFLLNGIVVLTGGMGKEEFRSSGISSGLLGYGISKFYVPAIAAYATFYFLHSMRKTYSMYFILFIAYIFTFIIGLSWGFKSTGISMLLPSMALIFWRISMFKFSFLVMLALLLFAFLALQFDSSKVMINSYEDAFFFILQRITIYQSEVPWKVWDNFINNDPLPSYLSTLVGILGNTVTNIFGITIDKIDANFGLAVTYFVYPYKDTILNGFNVTSTFFVEALMAFGYFGLIIFPIVGGFLAGLTVNGIRDAYSPVKKIMFLIFFFSCIYAWMKSGGISAIIHLSVFIHLFVLFILLNMIKFISKIKYIKPTQENISHKHSI